MRLKPPMPPPPPPVEAAAVPDMPMAPPMAPITGFITAWITGLKTIVLNRFLMKSPAFIEPFISASVSDWPICCVTCDQSRAACSAACWLASRVARLRISSMSFSRAWISRSMAAARGSLASRPTDCSYRRWMATSSMASARLTFCCAASAMARSSSCSSARRCTVESALALAASSRALRPRATHSSSARARASAALAWRSMSSMMALVASAWALTIASSSRWRWAASWVVMKSPSLSTPAPMTGAWAPPVNAASGLPLRPPSALSCCSR